jgi:phage shock protein C
MGAYLYLGMWQNRNFPEASMFCTHCGKQIDTEARFCPACGAPSQPVMYGRAPFPGQLTRPRHPRVIAGVCAGLALHYGWDLSVVRVLAVVALFVSCGTAMLLYFAAWIIIPDAPYALTNGVGTTTTGTGI